MCQYENKFLGLNLVLLHVNYLLLVSLSWNCRGLCKQTIIEIFNPCNFHLFLFSSNKKEFMAGILTVCKKKTNCVGFRGMNCANMKTKIMQECVIL